MPARKTEPERHCASFAVFRVESTRTMVRIIADAVLIRSIFIEFASSQTRSGFDASASTIRPSTSATIGAATNKTPAMFTGLNDTLRSIGNTMQSSQRSMSAIRIDTAEALARTFVVPLWSVEIRGIRGAVTVDTNMKIMATMNTVAALDLGFFIQPSMPAAKHNAPAPTKTSHGTSIMSHPPRFATGSFIWMCGSASIPFAPLRRSSLP